MTLDVGLTWLLTKDRFTAEEKEEGAVAEREAKASESKHYSNAAVAGKDMFSYSLPSTTIPARPGRALHYV